MATAIRKGQKRIKLSNITVKQDSTSSEVESKVDVTTQLCFPSIGIDTRWLQNGVTVAGGNSPGSANNQLKYPWGVDVDDDQTVYVSEYSNHRIVKWKYGSTEGQVVAGGNKQGNRNNQLNSPANVIIDKTNDSIIISDQGNRRVVRWSCQNRTCGETIISDINCWGLAMDNNGYLYASDYKKHEVKRWRIGETCGIVIAGGNGKGDRLDQFNFPAHLFVDKDNSVYVSDIGNHRLMKWIEGAKEGIVVAGGHGEGKDLIHLSYPTGIVVDQLGTIYIVDSHNHRVMRWLKGDLQGNIIVGGNEQGVETNQLNGPVGLSFDRQGNLYVADNLNHRIQMFNIDSNSNS